MIVVIDNYDSFVHNLARYLRLAGAETLVVRNDTLDAEEVAALRPAAVVLSPGPGAPGAAGCAVDVARRCLETATPLLGVCLGHQAIVEALGGRVGLAPEPLHGHTSRVEHTGEGLFAGLPSPLTVCRYHSLAADRGDLPADLRATATSDDGVVMAIQHRRLPAYGVQFHPEAVLTEHGQHLIDRFVAIAQRAKHNSSPPPERGRG